MGSPLPPGTKLGHYKVLSQIGAGGMGEVYLAQDNKLDRKVALKILPEEVAREEKRMNRFSQEAKAASGLNHPNILTIYEIGETDGRHFMVMEFVDGVTLRERLLRRDALSLFEVLDIAIQVSSALAAAHATGIIHRDIKPDNLMLRRDGFVKVLDFGLAKLTTLPGSEINIRARELDPLSQAANSDTGFALLMARRYDQAVESLRKTIEVEPKHTLAHVTLGYTYAAMGKYAEAIAEYQGVVTAGDDTPSTKIFLGAAYARIGQRGKAEQILRELESSKRYVSPGELPVLYIALGKREQAFASLEKAFASHDLQLQYLVVDPSFDDVRADPRFLDLLRRVGLPVNSKQN